MSALAKDVRPGGIDQESQGHYLKSCVVTRSEASNISRINKQLDVDLAKFAERPLEDNYPYLILDARYEKVR